MRLGEQGRAADEHEVPADPEAEQREVEGDEAGGRDGDAAAGDGERHAGEEDGGQAEALDQMSGEEGRRIHADEMPLDDVGAVVDGIAAADRGERRGGHDQHHHGAADHVVGDGGERDRLPHDDRQRPRRERRAAGLAMRRRDVAIERDEEQRRGEAEGRHHEIGAGEEDGKEILAPGGERRAENGGDDAAGENPRDRLGLGLGGDRIRRGEAVILREGLEDSDRGGAEAEQPEIVVEDRPDRDEAATGADRSAECEAPAPADALHQERGEEGDDRAGDGDHREGQGGERFVRGELIAGEAGEGEVDGERRGEERLADREDQRVARAPALRRVGIGRAGIGRAGIGRGHARLQGSKGASRASAPAQTTNNPRFPPSLLREGAPRLCRSYSRRRAMSASRTGRFSLSAPCPRGTSIAR